MKVGRITSSDRASSGVYPDRSGPEIERVLSGFFKSRLTFVSAVLSDDRDGIESELKRMADVEKCPLIVTTGGTGPMERDVMPEATRAVLEKELPGFGEILRMRSYDRVKTAILSRATAGVRGKSLIINLPGKPASIGECLPLLIPAIVDCVEHLTGEQLEPLP